LIGFFLEISIAGIARVLSISKRWVQEYIKKRVKSKSRISACRKMGIFFIEADEMWTFLGSKENDLWILLAVKRKTRLIVRSHIGKKDDAGAAALWNSLSEDCKKNGIFFTDG
jgi:hypothetical protein